jgi:hypothetical protein
VFVLWAFGRLHGQWFYFRIDRGPVQRVFVYSSVEARVRRRAEGLEADLGALSWDVGVDPKRLGLGEIHDAKLLARLGVEPMVFGIAVGQMMLGPL